MRLVHLRVYAPGFDLELVPSEIDSFVYDESTHGCAKWSLVLRTERYDKFDPFIKWKEDQPFYLEFGYKSPSLAATRKRVVLLESRRRTAGTSAVYVFRGLCAGHLLNLHILTDRVWEDKISSIVEEIVRECGFDVSAEETQGRYKISSGIVRAGYFICNYLMPLAYSPKGNDWTLTIVDGERVIFAPLDMSGNMGRSFSDYSMRHMEPLVVTLQKPELRKSLALRPWEGHGYTEVRSYSPVNARLFKYRVNERNANFPYLQSSSPKPVGKLTLVGTSTFHRGVNVSDTQDQMEVQREAITRWSLEARRLYELTGLIKFDPTLEVGKICRVVISHGKNGVHSPSTGLYVLRRVVSFFTRGELKSYVQLIRRWEM